MIRDGMKRAERDTTLKERVARELEEVAGLMYAAEQIADGLTTLLNHAYDHDHRTKEALAAANRAAEVISEERHAAERRMGMPC